MRDEPRARFERLADIVGDPVRRFLLRRTDPDTAQDVLADTFLVMWRRLDDVPEGAELPWAYAVARNCLANADRAARRHRGLVARIARLDPPRDVDAPNLPDPAVHRALAGLSAEDRELLRLSAWEDLAPREIAVVLGVTANAVSIRLHRARRRLADELARQEPGGVGHMSVEERRAQ